MEDYKMLSKAGRILLVALLLVVMTSAVSAQDQVVITLSGWSSSDAENAALNAQVAAFEAANPDIDVQVNLVPDYGTFMQTGFAAGDYPNVFYVDSFQLQDWASARVIAPLGDAVENPDGLYESLRNIFTYNDMLYCPAKDFSTLALVYNVDLFEAAGVAVPTNWDELSAAAAALTTADVAGLTTGIELPRFLPFLYQAGGAILEDGEVVLDSPEALMAVEYFVNMYLNGHAKSPADLGAGWAGEAFGQGKAAMTIEGNWIIQYMLDQFPDVNWAVAELPAGPAGQATMAFTVCYGVADIESNSRQTEATYAAAVRLVNFLTGEEGAMMVGASGFGPMPGRTAAADTWLEARGEQYQAFVDGAAYAFPWSFPPGFSSFIDTFNSNLNEAIKGNRTAAELLEAAAEAAQEALDDM
jgi:multiple sugar transport system substrate-binding protein